MFVCIAGWLTNHVQDSPLKSITVLSQCVKKSVLYRRNVYGKWYTKKLSKTTNQKQTVQKHGSSTLCILFHGICALSKNNVAEEMQVGYMMGMVVVKRMWENELYRYEPFIAQKHIQILNFFFHSLILKANYDVKFVEHCFL